MFLLFLSTSKTFQILRLTDSDYNPLGFGGWQDPAPDWSAYRYGDGYGYATMEIDQGSSLTWRFHHASDDRVLDEFKITK